MRTGQVQAAPTLLIWDDGLVIEAQPRGLLSLKLLNARRHALLVQQTARIESTEIGGKALSCVLSCWIRLLAAQVGVERPTTGRSVIVECHTNALLNPPELL